MRKTFISITMLTVAVARLFSQTIELDFPKLNGDTAWIYTFSGSQVDSLYVLLNNRGKAKVTLPHKNYQGLAYLYIPEKGGGEFILAENNLRITCSEAQFNNSMLQFPQTKENTFMIETFQKHNYLAQQKEWLTVGAFFGENKEDAEFRSLYNKMLDINTKSTRQLDDNLKKSKLYSARFMKLIQYMQRIYNVLQGQEPDEKEIKALIAEMENNLDINALYHSGNTWTDIHTYYPNLFYDPSPTSDLAQTAYANSIGAVMRRLEEPVLTAFLSTALTVCERTNRQKAQEVMLRNFVKSYPTLPITDTKLQRMLGALSINKGSQAPPIAGLSQPIKQPTIIIFFGSDCDHCINELNLLIKDYQKIAAKGYRVISISSDKNSNSYRSLSATFPWDKADALCDFKGYDGENFKKYGVVGTPMIFVVDKNGTITGKYAQMKEIGDIK